MIDDRPAQAQDRVVDSAPQPPSIETPATSAEFNNAVFATRPTDAPSAGTLSAVLPSSSGDVLSPKGRDLDCAITAGHKAQPAQSAKQAEGDVPVAPEAQKQERVINLRVASTVGNDTQYKIEGSPSPTAAAGSERPAGDPADAKQAETQAAVSSRESRAAHEQPLMPEMEVSEAHAAQEEQAQKQHADAEEQQEQEHEQQVQEQQAGSQEQKQPAQNPHVSENLFAMLFQSRRRGA